MRNLHPTRAVAQRPAGRTFRSDALAAPRTDAVTRRCAFAVAAAAALLGACGGAGDDHDVAPAVTAAGAHAYVEPTVAMRPGHVAIVRLAPVADAATVGDDGIARLRVHLEQPATYALAVDPESWTVRRLVLKQADGTEVGRHERGQAPATLSLPSGTHTLELHHAKAGDATAPTQTVFVRIAAAGTSLGANPTAISAIRAGDNCLNCDLSNADLTNLALGRNQDVSGSDFSGSNLTGALWLNPSPGVSARGANFSTNAASGKPTVLGGEFSQVDFSGSDFTNADMTHMAIADSTLDGANLSGATVGNSTAWWLLVGISMNGAVVSQTTRFAVLSRGSLAARLRNVVFPPGYTRLKGMDLRGIDFTGASFAGVDLTGADLTGAAVSNGSFANAKLGGLQPANLFATVTPTDVSGVDFNGLDLSKADFSHTVVSATTSFVGAKLSDDAGTAINLAGLALPPLSTALKGADLSGANLEGAALAQANLQGANLSNVRLHGANLNFANLSGAKMNGAQLGVAPGSGGARTTLSGAYMPNVDLTDADLRSADLSGAHLYGTAQLLRARFDGADFSGANLAGAALSGSLTGAVFDNASLVAATFNGATLTNASFDSALLQGADFSAAAVRHRRVVVERPRRDERRRLVVHRIERRAVRLCLPRDSARRARDRSEHRRRHLPERQPGAVHAGDPDAAAGRTVPIEADVRAAAAEVRQLPAAGAALTRGRSRWKSARQPWPATSG